MRRSSSRSNAGPSCAPGARLLLALAGLAALDCVILAGGVGETRRGSVALDAAIGGFAPGHSIGPAWSFHGFDPRGVRDCESELFPIVGAPCCDSGHRAAHATGTGDERP